MTLGQQGRDRADKRDRERLATLTGHVGDDMAGSGPVASGSASRREAVGGDVKRARQIREAINGNGLSIAGQPIVELQQRAVVGCEALARFSGHPDMSPVSWFRDADRYGLKLELELAAVQCGLLHLEDLPADAFIAINVSPRAAVAAETRRILDQVPLDRVVMEITEHEDVDSYAALSRSLLSLRVGGMQLAVDDAGAGFSSFKHVVHLQPDMIKLDGTWIEHVDADVARRALISAVVGFAAEMNAVVIGEWVETAQQARVLSDLGVNWGQGYYFGRPKPLRAPAAEGGPPN